MKNCLQIKQIVIVAVVVAAAVAAAALPLTSRRVV